VVPSHYDLTIAVDLAGSSFSGAVAVTVAVGEPTAEIVLNACELDVPEAWVVSGAGRRIEAEISLDSEDERVRLTLPETLQPGPASVHLRFGAPLNAKLVGFYKTTFTDPGGVERVAASTQFEATHARKAFPCWDEPEFKATFGVTLVAPEGELAISNARELSRTPLGDGTVAYRFADTMVMSTYLVAFVVGPFEATDPVDVGGTPLRVVYPRGQAHLTAFGLDAGAFGLAYFADYYGIPYPGDKCDLVAVPDFAFGAMENLGCITFREVLLLVDPATTTQPELQRVTDVIFHELAHMWFGDLVTMRWWNGLWLNEAFATFAEMKATDAYRPLWKRWVDFGLSRTAAFETDATTKTRAIEYPVISPLDAEGMFDILTYEKGAAVLRMIEQYLGEDAFRAGVRRYLLAHAYGNTETGDLWDAIETETGQPVRAMADSWIFQGGFPLVSAEVSGTTLTLTQTPFTYLNAASEARWKVPVILTAGTGAGTTTTHRVLLEGLRAEVRLDEPAEFVLINAGGHGFYRAGYGDQLRRALVARAQDHLEPIERYQLVDDTFAAVLAGHLGAPQFLELARGLADDDDLSVWQRLAAALGTLSRIVSGEDLARFEALVRDLAGPALDIAGWEPAEGESDRRRELRATLFSLLGTVGADTKVQERARALHARALEQPDAVDPSLVAVTLGIVARGGGEVDWQLFLDRSEHAPTPQEQRRYLYALADFTEPTLLDRTLELCRGGQFRSQDAPFVVARGLANRTNSVPTWRFVAQHWEELNRLFPSNTIVRMLGGLALFTDSGLAREVDGFFAEHPLPQSEKTLAQLLEKMAVNVTLAERQAEPLAALLVSG
jgi:puromycin-sensitive aminopeptidase